MARLHRCAISGLQVETSTLLAAASTQMQESRSSSTDASTAVAAGTVGVSVAASATMQSASSSGVVKFHSSAGKCSTDEEDSRAMFHTYVRVRFLEEMKDAVGCCVSWSQPQADCCGFRVFVGLFLQGLLRHEPEVSLLYASLCSGHPCRLFLRRLVEKACQSPAANRAVDTIVLIYNSIWQS